MVDITVGDFMNLLYSSISTKTQHAIPLEEGIEITDDWIVVLVFKDDITGEIIIFVKAPKN